ncbi:MAG: hypothetical protein K2H88_06440, partial [Duncaniella sp.]|nr:hypothetical protein [Duncaniella sp.]
AYLKMEKEYPLSPLMPKFMFLHALAYVTENKSKEFGETISDLLTRYPNADIAPLASEWLKGVKAGRELHSGGSNARGMLWDIRLSNDSTALAGTADLEFTLTPEEPHYLVLLFSTDAVSPNSLLYEVARHNFSTYVVRDFELETMNFGPLGLLIIKGFANQSELNHYRSLLARDGTFTMPEAVRPVEISKSNFEKLLQGAGSFDDYFRFTGEEAIKAGDAVAEGDEEETTEETDAEEPVSPARKTTDTATVETPDKQDKQEVKETPEAPRAVPDSEIPSTPTPTAPVREPSLPATDPIAPIITTTPPPGQSLPSYPIGSEGDEED